MQEDDKLPKEFIDFINAFLKEFTGNIPVDEIGNPSIRSFGFSFSLGPDGKPVVHNYSKQYEFQIPFCDLIEYPDHYEIIMDTPGINSDKQVKIMVEDHELRLLAVNGDIKYKSKIPFKRKVNKNISAILKNRTLIITVPFKN